ncbi:MAG: hypothetical protein HY962_08720 [Ignavibacteriae bacterium]|nr:hypothetical protein [Ignavibacteriota bacterium]
MKTAVAICLALVFACATAFAAAESPEPPKQLSEKQLATIRVSIEKNLQDPSAEIRCSTVQLVLELKETYPDLDFDYALIPLIGILKSDECAEMRILAARTLYDFDSELAHFAVSRRALYDSNERVARHCGNLARSWEQRDAAMGEATASLE